MYCCYTYIWKTEHVQLVCTMNINKSQVFQKGIIRIIIQTFVCHSQSIMLGLSGVGVDGGGPRPQPQPHRGHIQVVVEDGGGAGHAEQGGGVSAIHRGLVTLLVTQHPMVSGGGARWGAGRQGHRTSKVSQISILNTVSERNNYVSKNS